VGRARRGGLRRADLRGPRADDAPERIRYIQVAAGEISLDIDPEPLAKVEQVWPQAGSDRRIVFVP
jgi:hypothetical protein